MLFTCGHTEQDDRQIHTHIIFMKNSSRCHLSISPTHRNVIGGTSTWKWWAFKISVPCGKAWYPWKSRACMLGGGRSPQGETNLAEITKTHTYNTDFAEQVIGMAMRGMCGLNTVKFWSTARYSVLRWSLELLDQLEALTTKCCVMCTEIRFGVMGGGVMKLMRQIVCPIIFQVFSFPLQTPCMGSFTRRTCKMNPRDLGNRPSAVPG